MRNNKQMLVVHWPIAFSWLHTLCIDYLVQTQIFAVQQTSFGTQGLTFLRTVTISIHPFETNWKTTLDTQQQIIFAL